MDNLTFIVEMTKALAIPVAVVVVFLLFREDFSILLLRIRKGKLGPAEMEFAETVKELQSEVDTLPNYMPTVPINEVLVINETTNLRATILEAWLNLEEIANKLARTIPDYDPGASRRGTTYSMNALYRAGLLKERELTLLRELRNLRNKAVHNPDFSPSLESVVEYLHIVKKVEQSIMSRCKNS